MITLPEEFIDRMRFLLGEEAEAFFDCYHMAPSRGLRVNTLKISPEALYKRANFSLTPIETLPEGFVLDPGASAIGIHPYHLAGLFYLQDPSAMAVAAAVEFHEDMRILDLCAAPGGKSGAVAARMKGGMLLANDVSSARARTLQHNLERLGVGNAVVTSLEPAALCAALPEYFDAVLVDAPCSGEGMFRKDTQAVADWSVEHVRACAQRQRAILESACRAVAGGGQLIYSTCTFSREENEAVAEAFCLDHPQFEILSMERLYPHTSAGEGHFICRMVRHGRERREFPAMKFRPAGDQARQFLEENFAQLPQGQIVELADGRTLILPFEMPEPMDVLRIHTAGVKAGDARPKRFEPAHGLFMAAGAECRQKLRLTGGDVFTFLFGETLSISGMTGYVAACVEDFSLGFGKAVDGILKNHLPKGLRIANYGANMEIGLPIFKKDGIMV